MLIEKLLFGTAVNVSLSFFMAIIVNDW